MMKVYIAPLGAYIGRVLRGIIELKPDIIYLLTHKPTEEGKSWIGFEERKISELKMKLGVLYDGKIFVRQTAIEDYVDVFNTLCDIVEKHRDAEEIWINISSTTTLPAFAAYNLSTLYQNVHIFYVPRGEKVIRKPEEDYDPVLIEDQGPPGNAIIELPVIKIPSLSEEEKLALIKLYELGDGRHEQSILFDAMSTQLGWKRNKTYAMRLGRILERLEKNGFIKVYRVGRLNTIALTPLGKGYAKALCGVDTRR